MKGARTKPSRSTKKQWLNLLKTSQSEYVQFRRFRGHEGGIFHNPKLKTLNRICKIVNLKLKTLSLICKLQTPNPKPQTLNPKP
jgi:hypothetical protein